MIFIQLYSNYIMTSLTTSNQLQNYLSPTTKSIIGMVIKGKLPDPIEKEPNC